MTGFEFIDSLAGLQAIRPALDAGDHIALDTEFVRERTYYPQWCLMQIAAADRVFVIDVLVPDVAPAVAEMLGAVTTTKVFHSARQDLEVIAGTADVRVAPLFDTQIAAALLGYPEQVGYAALVKEILGIELPKDATRTDWSRRPLSDRQLEYAAEDVVYLEALYPELRARLAARQRLAWAEEDSLRIAEEFDIDGLYAVDNAVERVKGAARFGGRRGLAARLLASWRERAAQQADRPRRWLVDDRTLLAWAELAAADRLSAEAIDARAWRAHGRALDRIQEEVRACAEEALPAGALGRPPSAQERRAAKRLAELVAERAGELGLEPTVLARRRDLEAAARGRFDGLPFTGWRREIIGEEITAALG